MNLMYLIKIKKVAIVHHVYYYSKMSSNGTALSVSAHRI